MKFEEIVKTKLKVTNSKLDTNYSSKQINKSVYMLRASEEIITFDSIDENVFLIITKEAPDRPLIVYNIDIEPDSKEMHFNDKLTMGGLSIDGAKSVYTPDDYARQIYKALMTMREKHLLNRDKYHNIAIEKSKMKYVPSEHAFIINMTDAPLLTIDSETNRVNDLNELGARYAIPTLLEDDKLKEKLYELIDTYAELIIITSVYEEEYNKELKVDDRFTKDSSDIIKAGEAILRLTGINALNIYKSRELDEARYPSDILTKLHNSQFAYFTKVDNDKIYAKYLIY